MCGRQEHRLVCVRFDPSRIEGGIGRILGILGKAHRSHLYYDFSPAGHGRCAHTTILLIAANCASLAW